MAELRREDLEHEDLESVYVSYMAGYMDENEQADLAANRRAG
jgi:hypothetical protein